MKLQLPNVTLVSVETREHKLMNLAVNDCLDKADFGHVLILTDRAKAYTSAIFASTQKTTFCRIEDAPDKLGWCRQSWYDVTPLLTTSHALQIQWDSWICDPTMWRDDFLQYDFIGAPWWYKDGKNVGNSGFSLISTRLKRYLYDRRDRFPCDSALEDDLMCRKYRPQLEDAGFVWAPEWVAHNFAFECCRPSPHSRHFGFHAMFNWPYVLEHDRLLERVELAFESEYIRNGYMMKAFSQKHPAIIEELLKKSTSDSIHAQGAIHGGDLSLHG